MINKIRTALRVPVCRAVGHRVLEKDSSNIDYKNIVINRKFCSICKEVVSEGILGKALKDYTDEDIDSLVDYQMETYTSKLKAKREYYGTSGAEDHSKISLEHITRIEDLKALRDLLSSTESKQQVIRP